MVMEGGHRLRYGAYSGPPSFAAECRTKGVFVHAMELKATEKLIKQRWGPEASSWLRL